MTDDSLHRSARSPSRRRFLGTAAAVGTAATAGCLGSILGTAGSDENEIEPEEPSEPRAGTPGEFYTLVERNDIPVESLRWDGSDLVMLYDSQADTEAESRREIEVVTTVFNEILVRHDAGVGTLFAENTTPFEGQAHGWGVKTEWCERYNEAVAESENETSSDADDSSGETETEPEESNDTNETSDGNATNETDGGLSVADSAAFVLMNNVFNSRVYAEDLED